MPEPLLDRLTGVRRRGDSWVARCPAHEDRHASLSVGYGDDGRLLVHCHAGCEIDAVLGAINLTRRDLYPQNGSNGNGTTRRHIAAIYNYDNVDRELQYQCVRYDTPKKDFCQRRPNGYGGHIWSTKGVTPLLYRLPDLQGRETVIVVEGEKDVKRLWDLGLPATCNHGGAGKWKKDHHTVQLRDAGVKRAVVIQDTDDAGRRHAKDVARSCDASGLEVKLVELPLTTEGADVSDYLDKGGTKHDLATLIRQTAVFTVASTPPRLAESSVNGQRASSPGDSLPVIDVQQRDLAQSAAQAWAALMAANEPPSLFRYGGLQIRIEHDDERHPLTCPLTVDRMRHHLARAARWLGSEGLVNPPLNVAKDLLADPAPPLPILGRIVTAPVFTAAGAIHHQPGYDAASRLYLADTGVQVPDVPSQPGPEAVAHASDLITELLEDFPFTGDAKRAHAVALLLLPFVRDFIDGATPAHLIEKPSPGTGASLLVDVLLWPALGQTVPMMTEARDEDEWRKRVTSALMTNPVATVIDNARRRVDSAALSSAITSSMWQDRLLGKSEMVRIPIRCAWVITGNNVAVSHEIARRTVRIRLDAKVDRPWLRKDVRHANLRQWTAEHRGDLIWAALTLGRAWLAVDRPETHVTLGMFERWTEVIGGILTVGGFPGFLENRTEFYDASDAEGATVRQFIAAWWDTHADTEVGVRELWPLVNGEEPIAVPLGKGTERSQRTALGYLVADLRDRTIDGYRVMKGGTRKRAQLWHLDRVKEVKGEPRVNVLTEVHPC